MNRVTHYSVASGKTMNKVASAVVCLSLMSTQAIASDACNAALADSKSNVQAIVDSFQQDMATFKSETDQGTKSLQSEEPKSSTAENVVNFKFKVDWKDEKIAFDMPEVTLKDQKISLDLPETRMVTQKAAFDVPETTMEMSCIPGPPETVCGMVTKDIGFGAKIDVPECRMRPGNDICTMIPVIRMVRHEIYFDVPETTMKTREFILGVPEITMRRQEWILRLPQFTLVEVSGERRDYEQKAKSFAQERTNTANAKSELFQSNLNTATEKLKTETAACETNQLELQEAAALKQIDDAIAVVSAGLDKAREVGASEQADKLQVTLADLVQKRQDVVDQFTKAREGIAEGLAAHA